MSEIALRLPGPGSVLASQIRYQLTLLGRNPRAIVAGLVLPGARREGGGTHHGPFSMKDGGSGGTPPGGRRRRPVRL